MEAATLPTASPTMNLDSLLSTSTPPATQTETPKEVQETPAPVVVPEAPTPVVETPAPAVSPESISTPTNTTTVNVNSTPTPEATVAPTTPAPTSTETQVASVSKTKGIKAAMLVMGVIALGATGFFLFKTMYPIEYANMSGSTDTSTGTNVAIISGDFTSGNNETIPSDTLATTDTGMEVVDHGSAGNEDNSAVFTDIADMPSSTTSDAAGTISKLQGMSTQGKLLYDEGKQSNNTILMKFGGYVWKKAESLANSLESGETLDKQMIDNYLAQFQGYLTQLKAQQTNNGTSSATETS